MRTFLIPMMAISVGLSELSTSAAQDVVAKKIVVGAITSVDKAAGTFTLDNKGEPLELTIHDSTDGAGEIVKGRRVTVMYGQSLDGDEMLALRVKPSKGGAKPATGDLKEEPAPALTKSAGPKSIRVTGSGVDSDKARQAAFTQAIEQQVGLLVDSDTIVENDELIRDVVRTFSKGKLDSYKVIKEWQEDGLHHATIEAMIGVEELAGQLTAKKVPIHRIDGEKIARQGDYDRDQKDNAAAIVGDDFPTYKLTDYFKATLVDKPKIEGAQTGVATMTVTVNIASDLKTWPKMAERMTRTLRRTLPRNGIAMPPFASVHERVYRGMPSIPESALGPAKTKLKQRGDDWAYLVMVAKGLRDGGPNLTYMWEGVEVPKEAFDRIVGQLEGRRYLLKVALKDGDGEVVQEQETKLTYGPSYASYDLVARGWYAQPAPFSTVYVGPYLFMPATGFNNLQIRDPLDFRLSMELAVSTDDLKRVKEVTAEVVERVPDATP